LFRLFANLSSNHFITISILFKVISLRWSIFFYLYLDCMLYDQLWLFFYSISTVNPFGYPLCILMDGLRSTTYSVSVSNLSVTPSILFGIWFPLPPYRSLFD
jgi:hypothetical protein